MQAYIDLINTFYEAFQKRDAETMVACYHPGIRFSDAVFVDLQGEEAMAMWRMLCERGTDLRIEFSNVQADASNGQAHWEAWYTFSTTGQKVHNIIDAKFQFLDGKIIDHQDSFNFWRWSSQALGTTGKLLGWTPFLQNKVQQQSRAVLDKYMQKSS